jgi:hypothetical protein
MNATITINFANATATGNNVSLALNGCSVSPGANAGVSVAMASALTNINILAGQVEIATAFNAQFNGSMSIAIGWQDGQQPEVTLNNLENSKSPATVTWPTESGPETQILSPGDPMILTGIAGS